ncbi:MAG: transglutaminase domain-containing protein [Hyphomicrobiaceae bacterium]|nr:transglutaminase domain-containing protein [Hyphomicrobiaceae bacterium]
MDRRNVLLGGAALALAPGLPENALAQAAFAPSPGKWRSFEVTTALSLASAQSGAQAWIPIPSFQGEGWMRPGETTWALGAGEAAIVRDPVSNAAMVHARWRSGQSAEITVVSRFAARDRAVSLQERDATPLDAGHRKHYTSATELLRLDGIAKETAQRIVSGADTDIEKARRIYEWIVDNTFRNPTTRGCGLGDIEAMLKTGNLSGKCADLNALYVGLARAAGIPARDIYGIRVAPSAFGFKSLGAATATITKSQHCRAEVFLDGVGWFPVDPADVRKVVLEEPPGKLALDDPKVLAARKALFGAWETNWLAYNDAHDLKLPGASGPAIPFFMYPQAETSAGRLDSLDPDTFKYAITARELPA